MILWSVIVLVLFAVFVQKAAIDTQLDIDIDGAAREWDAHRVAPHIYLGSFDAALDIAALRRHKIESVLSIG